MRKQSPARGYVTSFGYRRIFVRGLRKLRMEHVLVWEAHHGPVRPGYELHHVNGDKLDNRIENLQAVTRLEHKRIHSGCVLRDGVWWKCCRKCAEFKPVTDFYTYPGRSGVMGPCKRCCVRLAIEYKRKRAERRKAERVSRGGDSATDAGITGSAARCGAIGPNTAAEEKAPTGGGAVEAGGGR